MKRITVVLVFSMLLFAVAAQAQTPAPKPGPEHQALGVMVGTWETESENKLTGAKSKGSMTCSWENGNFFVVCRTKTLAAVFGYSFEEKVYTVYLYSLSAGGGSFGRGWVRGNNWTYVFENELANGKHRRRQYTSSQPTPNAYTHKWERSIDGEPWVVTSEGKGTKAK
jgi:hypothetical protein